MTPKAHGWPPEGRFLRAFPVRGYPVRDSQPPVKPARCRPRRMWGLRRIVCQIMPVRAFSIIATIGP